MMKRLGLKMEIISKYPTQFAFARACGKREDWLSQIINGRRDPTDQEKELIISKLGIPGPNDALFE
jgi:hypothetical protein